MNLNRIIARAKSILLTPRTEWPVIAAEADTVGGIFTGYVLILAAIPAIVRALASTVIGVSVPFLGSYRLGMGAALTSAVFAYVFSIIGIFIVALIVEALAPTFGGEKNRVQAVKTIAYAHTASWILSIVGIVPGLGLISALAGAVYSIYLFNMGLPFTMKCPPDKAVGYTAVTIIVSIVIAVLINLSVGAVLRAGGLTPGLSDLMDHGHRGSFTAGTTGSALSDWAKKMGDASKQATDAQKSGDSNAQADAVRQLVGAAVGGGKVESLAPEKLKAFLPDAIGDLKRSQLSVERTSAMGVQISKGTATYSDGAQRTLHLEVTDTGSLKGLVGFATGWAGVEQEKQTDSGYEKTYSSDGRLLHEKWDNASQRGEYGVVVANRFSVSVNGGGASIDDLKSAVGSIDLAGLEQLKGEGVAAN